MCIISVKHGPVIPNSDRKFHSAADMCSSGVTGGTLCPLQSGSTYALCPYLASGLACTATGELLLSLQYRKGSLKVKVNESLTKH